MATVRTTDTEPTAHYGAVTLPEAQRVDVGTAPCPKAKEHVTVDAVVEALANSLKASASQRAASEGRTQKSSSSMKCPSDNWRYVHAVYVQMTY